MSITCSACASTEVSEVMAVNLSGPLSLRPHQPVDALRVLWIGLCSTRPREGNLPHLSPYLSHGAGGRRIARGEVGKGPPAATVVERAGRLPVGRRFLPAARIYDRTTGEHGARWGCDPDRPVRRSGDRRRYPSRDRG